MDSRTVDSWFTNSKHIGEFQGPRQTYSIVRTGDGHYLVIYSDATRADSYHVSLVHADKLDAIRKIIADEAQVTTTSLLDDIRLRDVFDTTDVKALRFAALMALYVLVVVGELTVKKDGQSLMFTPVKK